MNSLRLSDRYGGVVLRPVTERPERPAIRLMEKPKPKRKPQKRNNPPTPRHLVGVGKVPLEQLLAEACKTAGVTRAEICERRNGGRVPLARTHYARLALEHGWSLSRASAFIGKSHGSLISALNRGRACDRMAGNGEGI